MFKTFPVILDVTKSHLNDMFQVSNNDLNTIKLSLSIKSDLLAFDLTGKTVRLAIKKPDGFVTFQTGGVTDAPGGLCEFILDRQSYLVEGMHEAEVMIYKDEETVVVTQKFFYKVNRAIMNDKLIESTNEFPAINKAIQAGELLLGIDIPAMVTAAETAAEATEGALLATTATNNAKEAADFATGRVDAVINSANQKVAETETARQAANTAASGANTQGTYAKTQGDYAKERGEATNTAISEANLATTNANAAKNSANTAAAHAQTQGDYAKVQGDYAKEQGQAADRARDSATQAAVNVATATATANEKAGFAQAQGDYAKTTADAIKTKWLPAVAKFADIATTYKTPSNGDTVMVTNDGANTGNVYRYEAGSWIFTQKHSDLAITDIKNELVSTNRQTQVINQGVSLLNGTVSSPVDIQVEGRTLIPLQNSNLIGDASYVLADKKTKVIVDNKAVPGVGKFKKNNTLTKKSNFVGKIAGSKVENPNESWRTGTNPASVTSLLKPTDPKLFSGGWYSEFVPDILGGALGGQSNTNINGGIAQHLMSFDLIAEIERNMGRIPGVDTAAKVQWLKDNVNGLTPNWHGFGSGPTGNKASFTRWYSSTNAWESAGAVTHTSGVVTKLSMAISAATTTAMIDTNGFVHFIAYADPSDGVTSAVISTDFIELQIDLKSTAQLDTKPVIIRTANFEGKIANSTVENPHVFKTTSGNSNSTSLMLPDSGSWIHRDGVTLSKTDASYFNSSTPNSGAISQQIFSFDLIAEVERNLGRIPAATVAGKVQWLKDNINRSTFNWYGYGSNQAGNKATITLWSNYSGGVWDAALKSSHSLGTVQKLTQSPGSAYNQFIIQSDGFVHLLANSEASDGVATSMVNTDYVELDIELKPTATLHDPSVPLFEVDATNYAKILVDWNEAEVLSRYSKVTGVQHIQNPYVIAESDNLAPLASEITFPAATMVKTETGSHSFNLTGSHFYGETGKFAISPNQDYIISFKQKTLVGPAAYGSILFYQGNTYISEVNGIVQATLDGEIKFEFKTPVNADSYMIRFGRHSTTRDFSVEVSELMLTLGTVKKSFTTRNPSYLFAQTKLGHIGTARDLLYKVDGKWTVKKSIEKDIVVDGSMDYTQTSVYADYNLVRFATPRLWKDNGVGNLIKPNGESISLQTTYSVFQTMKNAFWMHNTNDLVYMTIPDTETGFGATYTPIVTEWKAYFNGWIAKTVDGTGKPTAWKSIGDGTDAPTQTIAYVSANKAPNYMPYKLSYVLATSLNVDISDQVEGDISINGLTQVELGSGVIVREKVAPFKQGTTAYHLNNLAYDTSKFKNRARKILGIFKNGIDDTGNWSIETIPSGLSPYTNGITRAQNFAVSTFDATAEYKATYLLMDRDRFTVNPFNTKAIYSKNVRSALDETVNKVENNTKDISILIQTMAEMYKRLKAIGG